MPVCVWAFEVEFLRGHVPETALTSVWFHKKATGSNSQ